MLYSLKNITGSKGVTRRFCPAGLASFMFVMFVALMAGMGSADEIKFSIAPSEISISAFYDGAHIKATGTIPAGSDVVIRITGEGEEVHLKKKGKVGGLLWMNTGKLTFKNVPAVFMIYTTPDVADIVNHETINLGYFSAKDQIELEPENEAKEELFKEFVKLKESEGVYVIDTSSVKYTSGQAGTRQFEADIAVPPKMKPGEYVVEAYAVQKDNIVARANAPLVIKLIGFPAWIASLAFGHELLYGTMAVVVAVAAGLLMGVIFKDKGGAH